MSVDTPFDPGADSCTRRSAQLLGILGLLVALLVLLGQLAAGAVRALADLDEALPQLPSDEDGAR